MNYLENWSKFEKLTRIKRNRELNVCQNKAWKDMGKDGKLMWNNIEWNGYG